MPVLNLTFAPDHHDTDVLPGDSRSKVIFSKHKPTSLVVFVHGFRGDALETWQRFDELTILNPAFQKTDLLFFGYDAYLSNVLAGSSFLYDLLNTVDSDRSVLTGINKPSLLAARAQGYCRVILVAHSLGAVVARWAILRAVEEDRPWRTSLKLLLFAPAHTGSDLASLATVAASGVPGLSIFVEAAKAGVPLVKELDPNSRVLAELADRVRRVPHETCLRSSRVVIAEREVVVSNVPFPGDPCPDAIRDTDHISVCKVSNTEDRAVHFLKELLP